MGRETWGWLGALLLSAFVFGCTERAAPGDHPDAGALFDTAPVADANADARSTTCRSDADCADRFACTIDHCTGGACDHVACTDCCGTGRSCDLLTGCGPTPQACTTDADCSDAQPCTLDACRSHVCQHQPMDALCPSGHICIGAIGCTPRPPDHCTTDAECMAIGFCYGHWTCAGEVGCAFVGATDCDDADTCTSDRCDATANMCVHEGRDADGDHHVDATCTAGDDCDDAMASIHPGASEACNGHDDDCDTTIDEGCCASGPCMTSCHTMGTTTCNPDGTVGACVAPAETCNGADDDCDSRIDEDFGCVRDAVGTCSTSCGTMGTSVCDSSCHAGACVAPAETCNGADDDCVSGPDNGFDCVRGASSACTTSCGSMGMSVCDAACHAGACVPPMETCNGMDDDCVGGPDNGLGCVLGSSTSCPTSCGSTGTQTCVAGCTYGACAPPAETCNGVDDNCNGARDEGLGMCYAGESRTCTALGFVSGTAFCRSNCASFDTSTCSNCGNGMRDAGEACDMGDLGGASCTTIGMGFNAGTLGCFPSCTYNTTMCTRCGDNVRNGPEQCDGADLAGGTCANRGYTGGGTLSCSAACAYDTSACIWSPTGTWLVTPGVTYQCAFGLVNFSFGNLTFNDTGSAFSVSGGGLNCTMTMPTSARVTRMFDVSCTVPGACAETYRLTGTFTSDNAWTGSFTRQFTGGAANCADCTTRTTSGLSGSR